jgi:hypothetical protein
MSSIDPRTLLEGCLNQTPSVYAHINFEPLVGLIPLGLSSSLIFPECGPPYRGMDASTRSVGSLSPLYLA